MKKELGLLWSVVLELKSIAEKEAASASRLAKEHAEANLSWIAAAKAADAAHHLWMDDSAGSDRPSVVSGGGAKIDVEAVMRAVERYGESRWNYGQLAGLGGDSTKNDFDQIVRRDIARIRAMLEGK